MRRHLLAFRFAHIADSGARQQVRRNTFCLSVNGARRLLLMKFRQSFFSQFHSRSPRLSISLADRVTPCMSSCGSWFAPPHQGGRLMTCHSFQVQGDCTATIFRNPHKRIVQFTREFTPPGDSFR